MITLGLIWIAIGIATRVIRGRGVWWKTLLLGPLYPLLCLGAWICPIEPGLSERNLGAIRRATPTESIPLTVAFDRYQQTKACELAGLQQNQAANIANMRWVDSRDYREFWKEQEAKYGMAVMREAFPKRYRPDGHPNG